MDAELKAYLDGIVETITMRMADRSIPFEQRMDMRSQLEQRTDDTRAHLARRGNRLEQRTNRLEQRVGAMGLEVAERFVSVNERFSTIELRIEQFERRVTDQLAALMADVTELKRGLARLDRRVTNLENQSVWSNTRLDSLHSDMRQRLRVLTTDLARSKIGWR